MRITRKILHFLIVFMVLGIAATLWNHHDDPNRAAVASAIAEELDALILFGFVALIVEGIYRWSRCRLDRPSET